MLPKKRKPYEEEDEELEEGDPVDLAILMGGEEPPVSESEDDEYSDDELAEGEPADNADVIGDRLEAAAAAAMDVALATTSGGRRQLTTAAELATIASDLAAGASNCTDPCGCQFQYLRSLTPQWTASPVVTGGGRRCCRQSAGGRQALVVTMGGRRCCRCGRLLLLVARFASRLLETDH